jgi:hypothetical protein
MVAATQEGPVEQRAQPGPQGFDLRDASGTLAPTLAPRRSLRGSLGRLALLTMPTRLCTRSRR